MTRALVLSQTPIADDPRVRKQVPLLQSLGWEVLGIGTTGARTKLDMPIVSVEGPVRTPMGKASLAPRLVTGRLGNHLTKLGYWSQTYNRRMYELGRKFRPSIVHANDWRVLPIAVALKRTTGARVIYDSHEWAVEEQAHQIMWRMLFPPFIRRIEESCIADVDVVVTVADGIADLYMSTYSLADRPKVVRNVPPRVVVPVRRTGERINVLYQGMFGANRGLAELIHSVAAWPTSHDLILRGVGSASQIDSLQREIAQAGVGDRVVIDEAAPPDRLVEAAASSDIGVHVLPPINSQTRFALPNKLFEYFMAGLAVCVSDAPEMAKLVQKYDAGVVVPSVTASTIADAIASLTRERVDYFRQQAVHAGSELNWEAESMRLLGVYQELADV